MQIQQQYGTEALKRFALKVLDLAKLDKDGDGSVSVQEWGQMVFGLVPELLNIKQLTNEVRDLTIDEITDLVMTVGANFPDYRNLREDVENVIRAAIKFLAVTTQAGHELFIEVRKLNKKPVESAPVVANTSEKKAKTSGALSKDQPVAEVKKADSAKSTAK